MWSCHLVRYQAEKWEISVRSTAHDLTRIVQEPIVVRSGSDIPELEGPLLESQSLLPRTSLESSGVLPQGSVEPQPLANPGSIGESRRGCADPSLVTHINHGALTV